MKATGVVRRIDELGRIVIPKEIRKTMRIREGEKVEIYTDGNENIVLRKYSAMKKLGDFAQNFTDSIYSFLKHNIIITDSDYVIAVSGDLKKEYQNKELSEQLITSIRRHETILEKHDKKLKIVESQEAIECTYVIQSIICHGDAVGLVIILSEDNHISELEERIAGIASHFLSKYLED